MVSRRAKRILAGDYELKRKFSEQRRRRNSRGHIKTSINKSSKWFKELWESAEICLYCGRDLIDKIKSADHIEPKANGGKSHRENIQIICKWCNNYKGLKSHSEMKLASKFVRKTWDGKKIKV